MAALLRMETVKSPRRNPTKVWGRRSSSRVSAGVGYPATTAVDHRVPRKPQRIVFLAKFHHVHFDVFFMTACVGSCPCNLDPRTAMSLGAHGGLHVPDRRSALAAKPGSTNRAANTVSINFIPQACS
jgi:hypothetical protein